MRIQRAMARAGVASRRHSEELIAAGRVTVNGKPALIGQSVDPERDEIRVDGKQVQAPAGAIWILLNKPRGVMTTRSDPQGRRTVFELVDDVPGLTYVGRLDYETEGLLLLTTDGAAANQLTHPSFEVEREYLVVVRGDVDAAVAQARRGVDLEDGPVRPKRISGRRIAGSAGELRVTIAEGRKREVRRLCTALGLRVERLIRVRYGPLELGTLESGKSRPLTPREVEALVSAVHAADRK
jgi:23S rRNA pseudouridine2605 synthase